VAEGGSDIVGVERENGLEGRRRGREFSNREGLAWDEWVQGVNEAVLQ